MDAGYRLALLTWGVQWPQPPGVQDMDTNDIQLSEHFSLNEMIRSDTAARKV